MLHNSKYSIDRICLALTVLVGVIAGATTANGDFVIFTGETWDRAPIHGTIPTPSGIDFDIDVERIQLFGLGIADNDLLIFDLASGTFELQSDTTPAELLDEDPFFQVFARQIEVQVYTEALIRFVSDPTDGEMNAAGALVWVGEIAAPSPGQPPIDSDGDGIPDESDNCPDDANADQANNDLDSLGDVCDPDDDNDGLSDLDEIGVYGTNPFLVDTDGDGASDLDEVIAGSDPLDPGSFPTPEVPGLGLVGLITLSIALMSVGYLLRAGQLDRRRRVSH